MIRTNLKQSDLRETVEARAADALERTENDAIYCQYG